MACELLKSFPKIQLDFGNSSHCSAFRPSSPRFAKRLVAMKVRAHAQNPPRRAGATSPIRRCRRATRWLQAYRSLRCLYRTSRPVFVGASLGIFNRAPHRRFWSGASSPWVYLRGCKCPLRGRESGQIGRFHMGLELIAAAHCAPTRSVLRVSPLAAPLLQFPHLTRFYATWHIMGHNHKRGLCSRIS